MIRVTVDQIEQLTFPAEKLSRSQIDSLVSTHIGKTVQLETRVISDQVSSIYAELLGLLSSLPSSDSAFELRNVSFTVVVDAEGKASLLSAISLGSRTQTGLTFTLSRKEN